MKFNYKNINPNHINYYWEQKMLTKEQYKELKEINKLK
jgi:hypothetical protein